MHVIKTVLLVAAVLLPVPTWGQLTMTDAGDGRIELKEAGRTALVYNFNSQLKADAPQDRRRCCYIFPVVTPGGVSVLDDFPKDHYHHHGIFWAWPVVEVASAKYDLWMYRGIQHRFEKWITQDVRPTRAELVASNGWYVGEKKVVNETARITLLPAHGNSRTFEAELTLEAVDQPVTMRGSPDKGKSYGGFSARFAPRENTLMASAEGPVEKDQDLVPHKWAELTASYGGKKATLRITPDPGNPGVPYQWCLRNYGFVGASFPGRAGEAQGHTLQPGKPVRLKFSVTVSDAN
jgi:hypothetical protein